MGEAACEAARVAACTSRSRAASQSSSSLRTRRSKELGAGWPSAEGLRRGEGEGDSNATAPPPLLREACTNTGGSSKGSDTSDEEEQSSRGEQAGEGERCVSISSASADALAIAAANRASSSAACCALRATLAMAASMSSSRNERAESGVPLQLLLLREVISCCSLSWAPAVRTGREIGGGRKRRRAGVGRSDVVTANGWGAASDAGGGVGGSPSGIDCLDSAASDRCMGDVGTDSTGEAGTVRCCSGVWCEEDRGEAVGDRVNGGEATCSGDSELRLLPVPVPPPIATRSPRGADSMCPPRPAMAAANDSVLVGETGCDDTGLVLVLDWKCADDPAPMLTLMGGEMRCETPRGERPNNDAWAPPVMRPQAPSSAGEGSAEEPALEGPEFGADAAAAVVNAAASGVDAAELPNELGRSMRARVREPSFGVTFGEALEDTGPDM